MAFGVSLSRGVSASFVPSCGRCRYCPTGKQNLCDNGAGFATQQAERLSLPFVRLHSAQQFPGVGLGLALARKCVQRLGGTLQLQGAPQQGCTAVLELSHLLASDLL